MPSPLAGSTARNAVYPTIPPLCPIHVPRSSSPTSSPYA